MHEVLRAATIEHMKDSADFYRQYMAVNNVRRNPKRRTAAAAAAAATTTTKCLDTTYYTEEQLQRQFEHHVEKMGQPGEWADNMEVSAFASALNVNVRLWQADYTYLFSPRTTSASNTDPAADDKRQTLHIAYHVRCRLWLPRSSHTDVVYIDLGALLLCSQYCRPPHWHPKCQRCAQGFIQEASKP
jgi:OTU domain-containing protein 3